jgi:hypothetical protein
MRLFLATLIPLLGRAAPDRFEVTSLPGWEGPLLTRMWSGFTSAGTREPPPCRYCSPCAAAMTRLALCAHLCANPIAPNGQGEML